MTTDVQALRADIAALAEEKKARRYPGGIAAAGGGVCERENGRLREEY